MANDGGHVKTGEGTLRRSKSSYERFLWRTAFVDELYATKHAAAKR